MLLGTHAPISCVSHSSVAGVLLSCLLNNRATDLRDATPTVTIRAEPCAELSLDYSDKVSFLRPWASSNGYHLSDKSFMLTDRAMVISSAFDRRGSNVVAIPLTIGGGRK